MSRKKDNNNFIAQAGILAIAGIISRIIGFLYRSPLNAIIGEEGLGYYQAAYGFYIMVLLISSYSIPSAISKVIAQKLVVREYRNAHRLFYGAMGYVLVVGAIASLFLYFGAGLFVEESAVPVLRVFAPTIFVYGILGVLRGYFQAHRSMVQTSVSQILEQIANAVVSVVGAMLLIKASLGTLEMPQTDTELTRRAVEGAKGSALGTGIGVFTGLVFMVGMYFLNRKAILKKVKRDRHEQVDSYLEIIKVITLVVTPFILATAIYNLNVVVNNYVYNKLLPTIQELDVAARYFRYGIFSGQALTVSNIPIAFATAMTSAVIPSVARLIAEGDMEGLKDKIAVSVKATMIISIPSAVGLFVLAKPIMYFLFLRNDEITAMSGGFLMALALSVVLYALSTLNQSILQGIGKSQAPIYHAAIALVVQTIIMLALLLFTKLDLYSIAIASTVYAGIMCVLNQISVRKAVGYRQEMVRTFVIPTVAALFMGVAAKLVYEIVFRITASMRIALIPSLIVAIPVYFVLLLLLRGVNEAELRSMPKGHLLVKAAKKAHLLR